MKKIISVILTLSLVLTLFPASSFAVSTKTSLSDTWKQNITDSGEQISAEISNNYLTITGTTSLPFNGGVTMNLCTSNYKYSGTTRGRVSGNTFYLEKDLSSLAPGIYKVNIYQYTGKLTGKGALTRMIQIKVGDKSGFVNYPDIQKSNTDIYNALDKVCSPSAFKNADLSDMPFVNKNPQTGKGSAPLTSSQVKYIKSVTEEITAGLNTDMDKAKAIFSFVSSNLYYDENRVGKTYNNPYYNLKRIMSGSGSGYNYNNGKVSVECTGYASLMIAMARSIGIPARLVNGKHNNTARTWDKVKSLDTPNHFWADVYVSGKWITADTTDGSENKFNKNSGTWTKKGHTNYMTFASSQQQLAQSHIVSGLYIKPMRLKLSSGSGYIKASWNKEYASGYQIQIAKNKGFTKSCKSYSITGTSKKYTGVKSGTYYLRIRPYFQSGSTKKYGKWSNPFSYRK